ncbi:MAG TPA: protein-L-isoaspartate O-methyltransferase [Xanthomonadaceae bacterium]|jgi:protein-L-isoaspartate(D-aspartate) O-methyltransferase|nr:protein-L-isoaspartate O-methyltransferase [Xanthomonadaceae bacterium]
MDFDVARSTMIEQQIRPWEVLDPRVLDALSQVRREDFVPVMYRRLAFADIALPLDHDESMLKPVVEGRMLQALDLDAADDVLEIGTGSGFLTACLARLAHSVTSIDIHGDFIDAARARLAAAGALNVRLEVADVLGWNAGRQFDAVCIGGAVAEIPQRVLDWVKPNGRLFVIRGRAPAQEALRMTRRGNGWHSESLFETDIAYLRGTAPLPRFAL